MNEVLADVEQAKKYQSINDVKIVDDKVTANFCYHEKENAFDCCSTWISYQKIFDSWKEFGVYADKFFKELNNSSGDE